MDRQLSRHPFFLLVIVVTSKAIAAADNNHHHVCPVTRCRDDGPVIKFPFRLKHDPPHCGHPQFEVSCFENMTMIQLSPSSGLFSIYDIDYVYKQFGVYDPNACLPRRLLNFTISSSLFHVSKYYFSPSYGYFSPRYGPFPRYGYFSPRDGFFSPRYGYYYVFETKNVTLLNCSTASNLTTETDSFMGSDYIPVTCLSVPGHQVLAVSSSTSITEVPFPTCGTLAQLNLQIRVVADNKYHYELTKLLLDWQWPSWGYFPGCRNCTAGSYCDLNSSSNQPECYPSDSIFPHPRPQQSKGHASTIIGVTIACLVFISAMGGAIVYHVKQSKSIEDKENQIKVEKFLADHKSHVPTRYSYADIKKMTNGFKKKLGEGGFGSVFSGKLPNGVPVAIKVLIDSKGNGDDFVNEVGTIGRIHHVNVVRLLGFSAEGGKRAVIYEQMPNRSLEKFISSKDQSTNNNASFNWQKLHNIIDGIAKGIEYLHQGCDQRILHFDIKPHNILLDHDFNPKISDFGLAKLCSKEDSVISMTAARGTVGYIAPEVFNGNFGSVSHKSDVYSFGMLVLETVGARKEPGMTSSNNEVYFPELMYHHLILGEALELKLDNEEDVQIAKKLVIVALWCIQWYPVNRPSMKAVVRMLEGAYENLIMPPNPFASTSNQTEPTS